MEGLTKECESLLGKHSKVVEWNKKSDRTITELLARVKELEAGAEKQAEASADEVINAKINKFVNIELCSILEEKVREAMAGKDLESRIGKIVHSLLGHKGRDGTIITGKQLEERGRLKSLGELREDPTGTYKHQIQQ